MAKIKYDKNSGIKNRKIIRGSFFRKIYNAHMAGICPNGKVKKYGLVYLDLEYYGKYRSGGIKKFLSES